MLQVLSKIQNDHRHPLCGLKIINDRLSVKKDMVVVGGGVVDQRVLRSEKLLLKFAKAGSGLKFKFSKENNGLLQETQGSFQSSLHRAFSLRHKRLLKKKLVQRDAVGSFSTLKRTYVRNLQYFSKGFLGYSVFLSKRASKLGNASMTEKISLQSQIRALQNII